MAKRSVQAFEGFALAMSMDGPTHGLPVHVIDMIRTEIAAALGALNSVLTAEEPRKVAAVAVLLEEILPEFDALGRKPWRAIPWLDCASHLLQKGDTRNVRMREAREHISAARDLLARE